MLKKEEELDLAALIQELRDKSLDDKTLDAAILRSKVIEGLEQSMKGEGVPHAEVEKMLQKWLLK